jgi:hypothetical protein
LKHFTVAKTVEVPDCGTVFTLGTAGGFAVTLPNASDAGKGWWCKFVVKVAPTTAYTINCTAGDGDNLHGLLTYASGAHAAGHGPVAADATNGTGVDVVTFVANKAKIGDQVELVTDGALWYATAIGFAHDGITFD